MFINIFQGRVSDKDAVKAALDTWQTDLAAGADGWLGTTAGVTDDGTFVGLVRFEDEAAGIRNGQRPEVQAWTQQMMALFEGDATSVASSDIDDDIRGDPQAAGFVQVMRGQTSDPDRARELMNTGDQDEWARWRPDILGTLSIGFDAGRWTMAIYFTSEEAARAGEQQEPPPEIASVMNEMNALTVGMPEFYDLRDPWLMAP